MRKFLIGLAAASVVAAACASSASAQVTGIRHTDGSWTYVDSRTGRDIHADYYARGRGQHYDRAQYGDSWSHQEAVNERPHSSRRHKGHKAWQQ